MYNYLQVKHTKSGDVLGQTLTFESRDAWLLEYHQQMKNAINNADVLGMSILVVDGNLNTVFTENWIREAAPAEEQKGQAMKQSSFCAILGGIGSAIANYFGGWDASLTTLLIFMGVDYLTGLIVAGVFHRSPKTASGSLESRAGWKGLCQKGVTLLIVLIACRLDLLLNTTFIRDAVVIAFVTNETLSIIENAGLMGVPIPSVIVKAIEVLKKKSDVEVEKTEGE